MDDIEINKITTSSLLQVRENLADISELATTINQKGLLQPLVVRTKADHYEIICGNRRYQACKKLGWKKITCHVLEIGDKEAYEISLIENIQRKTLSPIEEARGFKAY